MRTEGKNKRRNWLMSRPAIGAVLMAAVAALGTAASASASATHGYGKLGLTNHSYFNQAVENSPAGTTQVPPPLAGGVSVKGAPFNFINNFTPPASGRVVDLRRGRAAEPARE
jgi:hypothetical protein